MQAPKDFREELRKLNQMKQKLGKQRKALAAQESDDDDSEEIAE